MDDRHKTKEELIRELSLLRKKVKRAEQKVVRSADEEKKRLIELVDASPAAVTVHDLEGNFLYANQRTLDLHGYTREEFMALNIRQLDVPESEKLIVERARQVRERGEVDFEVSHFRKDGSIFPLQVTCRMTTWGKKKVVISIATDITERKEAEAAVRRSEEKYRDLFENANDAIFLVDANRNYVDANKKAVELLGYSREEILSMNILDSIPQEQRSRSAKEFIKLRREGKYEKFRGKMKTKDGRWLDVEVSSSAILEGNRYIGSRDILRDITEQARTEQSLRESEARLKEAQRIAHVGDWGWDVATNRVEWSEELYRIYGYEPHEIAPDYPLIVNTMHPDSRDEFLSAIDAALKGERAFEMDYAFFRKDGSVAVLHTIGKVIRGGTGAPLRMVGTVQDITAQKKAEESLLLFRNLLNQSKDAITVLDPATGRFLMVNDKACSDLGYDRTELLAMRTLDIEAIFPDQAAWNAHVNQVRSKGHLIVEGRNKRSDGTLFPVEVNVTYLTLGEKDFMVAVVRDITERKLSEQSLRISEERLSKAQKMAHVGCWEKNFVTGHLYWSEEVYRIYGVDPAHFTPTTDLFMKAMHPDDLGSFTKALNAAIDERKHLEMEYRLIRPDGTIRTVYTIGQVSHDPEGRPLIHSGTVQDITERKLSEQALRISEERLSKAQKIAHIGNWEWDLVRNELYWSGEVYRIFGLEPGKFIPTFESVGKNMHPDDFVLNRKAVRAAIDERRPFDMNYRLIRPDGTERMVHTSGEVEYDPSGKPLVMRGVIQDITDQRQAEEKLRQSEKFVRTILDTVDEGFIVIDRDFRIMTANNAYCGQVGATREKIIGAHCYEISHKSKRPCHEEGEECPVRYVFSTGEPYTALHRHTDASESVLYAETKGYPIKDESGAVISVIEVVNNVTEKHLLEEVRVKAQKLEAIGTLAGGIAHDYNNMLQGVFGYLYMAKTVSGDKERTLSMLEQAEQALNSCANLTKQLLTFSKGGMPVKKPIMIQQLIEDSVKFALSGSRSDYSITVDPDLWPVEADEGQIAQVIQNITLNADQAMPQSGTVMITLRNSRLPRTGPLHLMEEGNYIEIAIADTGVGISDQHLARIFDPYFTTKTKGSGLGLATSYSIVKNHGGMINVVSEVNKGTTFLIYLPALEAAAIPAPALAEAWQTARAGKILIMDDDELIREIAQEMLKTCGHEVEAAEHGEEAIEKYEAARRSGRPFDIVILDLTIRGGLGGKETIARLHEIEPGIRAIVSSGYSEDAVVADFSRYGFMARLTKPYKFEELRATVNTVMP